MALADKTRRELIQRLVDGERTMNELAEGFDMSLAGVSKHVKVLEKARLVKRRIEGRTHFIALAPLQLTPALDWISIYRNYWQKQMQSLTTLLNKPED
jgi:DNA-binding transcriptional ArsR family regulator